MNDFLNLLGHQTSEDRLVDEQGRLGLFWMLIELLVNQSSETSVRKKPENTVLLKNISTT